MRDARGGVVGPASRSGRGLVDCDRLDYLELVDAETLRPAVSLERPARAVVAAFYGTTRLIDNVAVGPDRRWT